MDLPGFDDVVEAPNGDDPGSVTKTFGPSVTGPSLHVRKHVDRPKRLTKPPAGRGLDMGLDRRSNPAERTGSRRPTGHALRRERKQGHTCERSGTDGVRVFLPCFMSFRARAAGDATQPRGAPRSGRPGMPSGSQAAQATQVSRPSGPARTHAHLHRARKGQARDVRRVRVRPCACTGACSGRRRWLVQWRRYNGAGIRRPISVSLTAATPTVPPEAVSSRKVPSQDGNPRELAGHAKRRKASNTTSRPEYEMERGARRAERCPARGQENPLKGATLRAQLG